MELSILKRLSSADDLRVAKIGLAMEKVMILRRGEKETFCFFPFSSLFFCGSFFDRSSELLDAKNRVSKFN